LSAVFSLLDPLSKHAAEERLLEAFGSFMSVSVTAISFFSHIPVLSSFSIEAAISFIAIVLLFSHGLRYSCSIRLLSLLFSYASAGVSILPIVS
jgi:hypothetical protein